MADVLPADHARRRMSARRYLPGDEARFSARADFAAAWAGEGSVLPDGPKWTLSQDLASARTVLGVCGLEEIGPGRRAAWAFMAPLRPRDWGYVIWASRRVFAWARGHLNARVIVAIPAPTPSAVRVLKRIGFVEVGEPYMIWEG